MTESNELGKLDYLYQFARVASGLNNFNQIAKSLVHDIDYRHRAIGCYLTRLTQHANLEIIGSYGYHSSFFEVGKRISVWDNWAACEVARTRNPVFLKSKAEYQERFPENASIGAIGEGFVAIPLIRRSELVGVGTISFAMEFESVNFNMAFMEAASQIMGLLIEPLVDSQTPFPVIKPVDVDTLSNLRSLDALTHRQREVLMLMSGGATYRQISMELMLSESLIKKEASKAFQKIGVQSRAEASRWSRSMQLEA
jgi:DNA-binding CsgD family transcriptional regulator